MWTRKQHEDAAQKIGETYVSSGGSETINDLSVKLAEENHLNPESIRTVVRLANVAAFEEFFAKRASVAEEDRMIDFQVGDPELVIQELHRKVSEEVPQTKTAEYNRSLDYFADVTYPKEPLEKTASAVPGVELSTPIEKLPSKAEVKLLFKRAEERMQENKRQAQVSWMMSLEKAAALLVAQDSRVAARTQFEKNAASILGESILPELRMVHTLTKPKHVPVTLFGGTEKIASIINTHIARVTPEQRPIIELLKSAQAARKETERLDSGLQWIVDNAHKVN